MRVFYLPSRDFSGPDWFSFTLQDSDGAVSEPASVFVNISAANDAPTVSALAYTSDEDTVVLITLNATDIDSPAGDITFAIRRVPPRHLGALYHVLHPSGPALGASVRRPQALLNEFVAFVPFSNLFGDPLHNDLLTSFSYGASDGVTDSDAAEVALSVRPVNDAPVPAALRVEVFESHVCMFTLRASDAEGDTWVPVITSLPALGTLCEVTFIDGVFACGVPLGVGSEVADGQHRVVYLPVENSVVNQSFTWLARDVWNATSNSSDVDLTLVPLNDPPECFPGNFSMQEDAGSGSGSGSAALLVTLHAFDVDQVLGTSPAPLNFTVLSVPANGWLFSTLDGAEPDLWLVSAGVWDGSSVGDLGSDSYSFIRNLTSGNASLPIQVCSLPCALSNAQLLYFAPPDAFGDPYGLIHFEVSDGVDSSPTCTVALAVQAVEDAPRAGHLALGVVEGAVEVVSLPGVDVDGDTFGAVLTSLPTQGTLHQFGDDARLVGVELRLEDLPAVVHDPQRRVVYIAPSNVLVRTYTNFTFELSDGLDWTGHAEVQGGVDLTLIPLNSQPTAASEASIVHAWRLTNLPAFVCGDVDANQNTLFLRIVAPPAQGLLLHFPTQAQYQLALEAGDAWQYAPLGFPASFGARTLLAGSRFEVNNTQWHQPPDAMSNTSMFAFWGARDGGWSADVDNLQSENNVTFECVDSGGLASEVGVLPLGVACELGLVVNVWTSGDVCAPCPVGAICSAMGEHAPLAQSGYFQMSATFYTQCIPPEACSQAVVVAAPNCAVGYTGDRCAFCASGFMRLDLQCVECTPTRTRNQGALVVLFVIYLVGAIAATVTDALHVGQRVLLHYMQLLGRYTPSYCIWTKVSLRKREMKQMQRGSRQMKDSD